MIKVETVIRESKKLPRYTIGFVMNDKAYFFEDYEHASKKLFVSTDPANANTFIFAEALFLKDFLKTIEGISCITIEDEWR